MSLRTRTTLFWLFALLFILLSSGLWFFAQGWRVIVTKEGGNIALRAAKTGMIAISVIAPADAEAFLGGKKLSPQRALLRPVTSDWLARGLAPGSYTITVSRDGYQPWSKTLEVYPGQVSAALAVLLAPQQLGAELSRVSTADFLPAQAGLFPNPSLSRALKLTPGGVDEMLRLTSIAAETLASSTLPVSLARRPEVLWNGSSDKVLIVGNDALGNRVWLLWDARKRPENLLARLPRYLSSPSHPSWHPFEANSLLLLSQGKIAKWNLETGRVEFTESDEDVLAYAKEGNSLWWLDALGNIARYDLILRFKQSLSEHAVPEFDPTKRYALEVEKGRAVISVPVKGERYLLEEEGGWLALGRARSLAFSPDGKKLAASYVDRIEVLFLEDTIDYGARRERGDREKINTAEDIRAIFWFGSSHLLVQTTGSLRLVEIDGRNGRYAAKLMELSPDDKIFYDAGKKIIYMQNKNRLVKAELAS